MHRIPVQSLMKVASIGGVFVIGNALLMRFLTQKKLKDSPYFVQARDILMSNQALVSFLGEPVGFGSVDLGDSKNFSTSEEARFEIPIKGSNHEGILYLWSMRDSHAASKVGDLIDEEQSQNNKYAEWNIKNLEITIKDKPNQKLILVSDSVLTSNKKSVGYS